MFDSLESLLSLALGVRPNPLSFDSDPASLGTVVLDQLTEPRVLERLPGGDSLFRVVNKDLPQKVQEQLVKLRAGRDDFFERLHGANELPGLPWGV